jgi:O-glycosyl hydrolase
MPRTLRLAALVAAALAPGPSFGDDPLSAEVWLTTADLGKALAPEPALAFRDAAGQGEADTITVDDRRTYQTMLGLGSSLEPATCFNLSRLDPERRREVIARLVGTRDGIGMNLMRVCIGTPDFTGDPWYSYDDQPPGATDPSLRDFSIEKDRRTILPILKQVRAARPDLLFFASPWSPPGWMKSTDSLIGGHVLPEHYPAYAEYFARFIAAYEAEGIPIHAVTVQNEPGVDRARDEPRWHYPSCGWTAEQERDFIRDHLGPTFRRHGIQAKIWIYDHNFNVEPGENGNDPGIAYPRTILSDPQAAAYVGGIAFHGYVGEPSGMTRIHDEFPDVPIHFTEGSVFGLDGAERLVRLLQNWASSYNAWVTMLDTNSKPNNGPFEASRTIVTLDAETRDVDYHFDYYMYGQFMRFIRRGAVRIAADSEALPGVAFRDPDGRIVLVVVNTAKADRPLRVRWRGRVLEPRLPAESVATFVWAGAER